MNKSMSTNLLGLACIAAGYYFAAPILLTVGLFSFSGAVTNWLAIHMLFEKVPGLYGSGVIPAHFEEFRRAIKEMMMTQFFTQENIDRFISQETRDGAHLELAPIINQFDLSPAFERLIEVIMQSSFGGMLNMFGGVEALMPLKDPFIDNMKASLIELSESAEFNQLLQQQIDQPKVMADIQDKVEAIIESRLAELTPQMVKEIIQQMIRQHLGWLVVWGGVFGGLIGLITSLIV